MADYQFSSPPRSSGSRWFMVVSLLAMAVMLALVGLELRKSGVSPASSTGPTPAGSGGAPGSNNPSNTGGGSNGAAPTERPPSTSDRNG